MNTNTQNQVPPLPEHARERLQAKVREVFGTPWRQHGVMVRDTTDTLGGMFRIQLDHGAGIIADPVAFTISREDADRIVRAVNAHEGLLEACRLCQDYLLGLDNSLEGLGVLAALDLAITKATQL